MGDTRERKRWRKGRSSSLERHGGKWRNPFSRSRVKDEEERRNDIERKAVRSAHRSLYNRVSLGKANRYSPGGLDEPMMSGALRNSNDSLSGVTSVTSKVGKPSTRGDIYDLDDKYLPEGYHPTDTSSLHSARTKKATMVDIDEATSATTSDIPSEPYTGSYFTGENRTLRNAPPSVMPSLGDSIDPRVGTEGGKASDKRVDPFLNRLKKAREGASTGISTANSMSKEASRSVGSENLRQQEQSTELAAVKQGRKSGQSGTSGIPGTNPAVSRMAAAAVKDEDKTSFDSSKGSRKSALKKRGVQGEGLEERSIGKRVMFADVVDSSRQGEGSEGQMAGSTSTGGSRLRGGKPAVRGHDKDRSPESRRKEDLLRNVIDPELSKHRDQSPNWVRTNEKGDLSSAADRAHPSISTNQRDKKSTKAPTRAPQSPPPRGDDNPDSDSDSESTISTATPPRTATRYVEALCAYPGCGDWIYVDPETYELVEVNPLPPEFCRVCGLPWPAGMPFTEGMTNAIRERLNESSRELNRELKRKGKKPVYCAKHATEMDRNSANILMEEKGIDDGQENITTRNDTGHDEGTQTDHYCKPMNFERYNEKLGLSSPADRPKFSGTKKALLIGINYSGQKGELRGCRTDVQNMYHYLVSNGYRDDDIDILLDIWPFPSPERKNILEHLTRLIDNARPGDSLFLHYSGHGGQIEDLSGDEKDGLDECIFPVDHRSKGKIKDDILHKIIVKLPKGAQLTALFDSCHSGSILDLPYELKTEPGWLSRNNKLHHEYAPDENAALENCGRIILWSGCRDKQTSAETKIDGKAVGAMSHAFIDANWILQQRNKRKKPFGSRRDKDYTYSELLDLIRAKLSERSQQAQLSASWELVMKYEKVTV